MASNGEQQTAHVTRASPRLRSLSGSGLVTSALKFCCVSLNFVVFWFAFVYQKILLCFGKDCCASGNFLVFWKRLLCSRIDCCVLEKIVVFWKRLLCSRKDCCVLKKIAALSKRLLCSSKDCCVSEQKLSCVLPLWATVQELIFNRMTTHFVRLLKNKKTML